MPLDRQTIQKRDFPIARRGYETAAVDGHLAEVAREVEALREEAAARDPASSPAPLDEPAVPAELIATSASDRVRAIVEAAEATATQIQHEAEAYAEAVRSAAERDARQAREAADQEARERVTAIHAAAAAMLSRVGAVETEVGTLLDHLHGVATGIVVDLDRLVGHGTEVRAASGLEPADRSPASSSGSSSSRSSASGSVPPEILAATEPPRPASPVWGPPHPAAHADEGQAYEPSAAHGSSVDRPSSVSKPPMDADAAERPPAAAERSTDEAGARMVAFSMVLDDVPREQIEHHLDERYLLADRAALLDDLYARRG